MKILPSVSRSRVVETIVHLLLQVRDASDVLLKMNNAVSKVDKLGRDIEKAMTEVATAEAELQSIVVDEVPVDTEVGR